MPMCCFQHHREMKNIKKINKLLRWLQLGAVGALTVFMARAMKMLYVLLKEGGSF